VSDDNHNFVPPDDGHSVPSPNQATYENSSRAGGPLTSSTPAKRHPWRIAIIVVASVLVLALIVAGLVFVVNSFVSRISSNSGPDASQPLVEGQPGSPTAVDPLECQTACFNADDIPETMPTEINFSELGLTTVTFEWGTYDPTTAGKLHRSSIPGWKNMQGSPDACFFAPGNAPASFTDSDESTDEIQWTGTETTTDKRNTLDQSVRFFPDSSTATAYMKDLANQIAHCDVIEVGSDQDYYSAVVTPAPQLDLPPSLAGVGWIRTGDPGIRWRAYVIDLQRGNLVVRTRVLTDGSITELQYRELVEGIATQIDAIEPLVE
jgi:hypothetical protein